MTEADPLAVRLASSAVSIGGLDDGDAHALATSALARLVAVHDRIGPEGVALSLASMSPRGAMLVMLVAVQHLSAVAFGGQEPEQE